MFALTGQIAASGAGALLALSGLSTPPSTDPVLQSLPTRPISLTAGYPSKFDVPVRNTGTGPVAGAVMSLGINTRFLAESSYRNCTADEFFLFCTFDTTLDAGKYYGLSEPLTLRTPADSITGSVVSTFVTWWSAAEYDALPKLDPADLPDADPTRPPYVWIAGPKDPRWGTGPELRLRELAGPPDAPPPEEDEEPGLAMTVTDGRSADLAVSGTRTLISAGRGTVRVTLTNHGPGRLHPDLYSNNRLTLAATFPDGSKADIAPERCWLPPEGTMVECNSTASIGRGGRETLDIGVRVTDPQADPGRVAIASPSSGLIDPDVSNDAAQIVAG